jgi:hypothetical protein
MPIVLAHDSGDPAKLCNIEFNKPVQAKQFTCLPNEMAPISQQPLVQYNKEAKNQHKPKK